ncbi:hypothetical protein HGA34_02640 [Candidatus Falkowbacteria bacterium]|nr:hypothetical protein [Candidatus Falkowbacteria bacterium]
MNNVIKTLIFAFLLVVPSFAARAATLYFTPSSGTYGYGDVFAVDVKIDIDSGDECINTVQGVIGFDKDYLEMVDFSGGESILSLWIDLPKTGDMPNINHEKIVKFTGGIPGGYCGKIPGDPGESNIIGKIIFKVNNFKADAVPKPTAKVFFVDSTQVLLNDGLGTEAKVVLKEAEFTVTEKQAESRKEWDTLKNDDVIPPEPFVIEIQRSQSMYNGKNYLIFNTTDKQSGVDHYEVLEARFDDSADRSSWFGWFESKKADPEWKLASIPYILEDQSLSSNIKVKAIDKAGNERIEEYFIKESKPAPKSSMRFAPFVVLFIIVALAAWLIFRKARSRNRIK